MGSSFWKKVKELSEMSKNIPEERRALSGMAKFMDGVKKATPTANALSE